MRHVTDMEKHQIETQHDRRHTHKFRLDFGDT